MARRRAPCQIRLSERTFGAGLSLQHAFGAADVHLAVRERQDCASPTWNSACAPASAARCRATSNIAVLVVQSERITDWSHIPSERRSDIAWAASNVDELLADLCPVLSDLLEDLTARQRLVARMALIDDLRQSAVADRLNVRRATISVSFSRARIRSLQRLVAGIRRVYRSGSSDPWRNRGRGEAT